MSQQTALAAAVTATVTDAVQRTAADPGNALTTNDVGQVAADITTALAKEPAVQHVTNTEPWYRSRVTLGALAAIFAGIGGVLSTYESQGFSATALWPHLTTIGGGLFALYGRWMAIAPLGEGPTP